MSLVRSRLPLRPRRLGDPGERRLGEREPRLLGEGDPRRLGDGDPLRLGEGDARRRGEGEPRRRGEGEPRRFRLPDRRCFGDGDMRRLRRSGVGERREEATVAFSPRSARTPRGEEERRVGLLPRSFVKEAFLGAAEEERVEAELEVLLERDDDVEPDDELSSEEPVELSDDELDDDSCRLRPLSLSLFSLSG